MGTRSPPFFFVLDPDCRRRFFKGLVGIGATYLMIVANLDMTNDISLSLNQAENVLRYVRDITGDYGV